MEIIAILCGGMMLLGSMAGGAYMIYKSIQGRQKATASQGWPAVQGVITQIWIDEHSSTDDEGYNSTYYTPRVSYRYTVGQYYYDSSRIAFGSDKNYSRRRKAQKFLETYPVNSVLRVYYNPQNPAEATLSQQAQGTITSIIVGIVLILVPICVACFSLFAIASEW